MPHCLPGWLLVTQISFEMTAPRKWQPIPVFLPGKSHGQRNLVGYSPWGRTRVRHNLATKATINIVIQFSQRVNWGLETDLPMISVVNARGAP